MKRRSDDLGQPPWQIISKLHDKNNKLKSADTDLGMCLQVLYHDCCYYFSIIISRASLVSDCKVSACDVGDLGSIPGLGRSPGEEKGYPLWYSGLENSTDYIVHGVAKSRAWLNDFHFTFIHTSSYNCFFQSSIFFHEQVHIHAVYTAFFFKHKNSYLIFSSSLIILYNTLNQNK